jgi:hypothetical protein
MHAGTRPIVVPESSMALVAFLAWVGLGADGLSSSVYGPQETLSLAITASGIILLYLLWDARSVEGETRNATTCRAIIAHAGPGGPLLKQVLLAAVLAFEAGLLFVAANTGLLGGPAVLSNMAADSWVPHKFRYLSTRLVAENGMLVMGVAALAILFSTGGKVQLLVVLYSISVFLTFAISLFGLCRYWWQNRRQHGLRWLRRFLLSLRGFVMCAMAALCVLIRHHYRAPKQAIHAVDEVFKSQPFSRSASAATRAARTSGR